MIEALAIIVKGHWRPGIGDPNFLGWVTTIGYFVAAGLCGAYALRARKTDNEGRVAHHPSSPTRSRQGRGASRPWRELAPGSQADFHPSNSVFWWGLAVFMLLMGFNKQLDLQVLVLQVGRQMSMEQGWYAERDALRKWVILAFGCTGLILIAWFVWTCRRVWRRYILMICGIALLVFFVVIRASADRIVILGYRPGKFPMYDILEVGGIVCIGASALMELRRLKRKTGDRNQM